jgi:hypothetical protein
VLVHLEPHGVAGDLTGRGAIPIGIDSSLVLHTWAWQRQASEVADVPSSRVTESVAAQAVGEADRAIVRNATAVVKDREDGCMVSCPGQERTDIVKTSVSALATAATGARSATPATAARRITRRRICR